MSLLSIDQLNRDDIQRIFAVADEMAPYARRERVTRVLEGAVLGSLFFEPSTRTRLSFSAAFSRLGGHLCETTGVQFSSMAKGESIHDTSRVASGYVDILVVRHPKEGSVQQFADATRIPVINGGDGPGEHPTQALLDLYTITKELRRSLDELRDVRIAMVGDLKYGRTVHSLTKLLSMLTRVEFVFVAPHGLEMPERIVESAEQSGHAVQQTEHLEEALRTADVVYTTRIQEERFANAAEFSQYRGRYSVNREMYERVCRPSTVLMHPLPRDSRPESNELDNDLNGHPALAIFRQTDNGIPIRMALFALILGVADRVHDTSRPVSWFAPAVIDNDSFDPSP